MKRQRDKVTARAHAIRKCLCVLWLVILPVACCPIASVFFPLRTVAAHKFHVSFTQLEYNAQEQAAEITLRVFIDDLENALSQRSGKTVRLDHKESASLVAAYLQNTLELKGRNGQRKRLTWIGMEPKADVVFLYVEAKIPEGLAGAQLRQQVFFELFDDQVNQVLVKSAAGKLSLDFKHGDAFKPLLPVVK